ncbi:MAG: hypothetical protein V4543_17330, partial [Bacteroidota bacterium]
MNNYKHLIFLFCLLFTFSEVSCIAGAMQAGNGASGSVTARSKPRVPLTGPITNTVNSKKNGRYISVLPAKGRFNVAASTNSSCPVPYIIAGNTNLCIGDSAVLMGPDGLWYMKSLK